MIILIAHNKSVITTIRSLKKKFIAAADIKPLTTRILTSAEDIAELIGEPVIDVFVVDADQKDTAIRNLISGANPKASMLVDPKLEGLIAQEVKF